MTTHRGRLTLLALTLLLTAGAAACSADPSGADPSADATTSTAPALTITDPWVKSAASGMTAAFGVLHNTSDADVTVVSGTTDAASTVELHEVAASESGEMVMRPVEGGLVVPAGGELTLEPGGLHIMLMGLTDPVEPGEDVTLNLTTADGSELVVTAPARSFDGGEETYEGDGETEMSTP